MTAHPVSMLVEARRLRDERPEMSQEAIARELGVSRETVGRWLGGAEATNAAERRRRRRRADRARIGGAIVMRMVDLKEQARLSNAAIAAVVNLDEGTKLSANVVRYHLQRYAPDVDAATKRGLHETTKDMRRNLPPECRRGAMAGEAS